MARSNRELRGDAPPAAAEAESTPSLRKQVEDQLRRAIVKGSFAPGEHLPDRALCDTYKVSRAIVREAVRQLEAEGLVVSVPNRGSFVRELTAEEAKQIYDVRAVLEAWAARKFVQQASDAELDAMVAELEAQRTALESSEQIDMIEHKQIYYDMLFAVYRNPYIQDMLNRAQGWSGQLRALAMMVPNRALNSVTTLERLIAALRARDEEGAWQASLVHVNNAAADALSILQQRDKQRRPARGKEAGGDRATLFEAGLRIRREILGRAHVDRLMAEADEFDRPLQELITEYAWGEVWTRNSLDRKTRILLNLAFMTALNRPAELEQHIRGALNNGVTKRELSELFLQSAISCGIPTASDSIRIARKVLNEAAKPEK